MTKVSFVSDIIGSGRRADTEPHADYSRGNYYVHRVTAELGRIARCCQHYLRASKTLVQVSYLFRLDLRKQLSVMPTVNE